MRWGALMKLWRKSYSSLSIEAATVKTAGSYDSDDRDLTIRAIGHVERAL